MMWTKPKKMPDGRRDPGQIGLVKMYQKYAGMSDQEYRDLLRQHTGQTSSTAGGLTQYDFDVFMAAIEVRAHLAETNQRAVGRRPGRIRNWYYWRNRCPKTGEITSREKHRIMVLWEQLCPFLHDATKDNHDYLAAMASHACGKKITHIHSMRSWQALALISALQDRLHYAMRSAS